MGMILGLVAVLVASVALVVLLIWVRQQAASDRYIWETVARAVQGRLELPSGFMEGTLSGKLLRVELGGVDLAAGVESAGSGQGMFVEAPVRQAGGWVGISPAGLVARLQVAAGAKDITLGEPQFDEAWVVKADDEAFARSCLDAEARRWIGQSRRYAFTVEADKVTARRAGRESDPAALEAAIRAVALLAGRTTSIRPAPHAGRAKARSLVERDPFLVLVGGGAVLLAGLFLPQLIRGSELQGLDSPIAAAFAMLLVVVGASSVAPAAHVLLTFSRPSAAPALEALAAAATGVSSVIALSAGVGALRYSLALVLLAAGFGLRAFKADAVWVRAVAILGIAAAVLTLLVMGVRD